MYEDAESVAYASINVLNLMRAATISQRRERCDGVLLLHSESFVEVSLHMMEVQPEEYCNSPATPD